jgi:hypothetical protein
MCLSDFVSRLPFCIVVVAMSVLLILSQYLYVPVYSPEKNQAIENNVRTVCLKQQMKIPRN